MPLETEWLHSGVEMGSELNLRERRRVLLEVAALSLTVGSSTLERPTLAASSFPSLQIDIFLEMPGTEH